MLDALQVSALLTLLEAERPISARALGERLGISARCLRYRVPSMRAWLANYSVDLMIKPRQGWWLRASHETRLRLRAELQHEKPLWTLRSEERHQYLTFLLLTAPESLTSEYLQQNLAISRATLARDLHAVEQRLVEKGLLLRRSRLEGVKIVGSEVVKRHLVIEVLFNAGLADILSTLSSGRKIRTSSLNNLQHLLLEQVSQWNLQESHRFISRIERRMGLILHDDDLLFLTLYWAVSLQRLRVGHRVVSLERKPEVAISPSEAALLEEMVTHCQVISGIAVPREEIYQLLIEIKACQGQLSVVPHPTSLTVDNLALTLAEHIFEHVGKRLGYDLSMDDIVKQMAAHFAHSLIRLQTGLPIYNPVTQEVQRAYPRLWRYLLEAIEHFEAKLPLQIPAEEVAYLVMYLALAVQLAEQTPLPRFRVVVACPTGGVMARLLVYRLQSAFPELQIVDTVSLRQLSYLDLSQVDVVIATVAYLSAGRLPVITVNPLLTEDDLRHLRDEFERLQGCRIPNIQKEKGA